MRVLQVHNRYRLRGGEDAVVDATDALLRARGIETELFTRDSEDLHGITAKVRGVFTAINSSAAKRDLEEHIDRFRPDVVHIHNVFPLLSPAVFAACAARDVPAVMTVHNYRLTCPIGVHYFRGAVCTKCFGGHEHHCALRNCRDNRVESAAYALRGAATRMTHAFTRHTAAFIAISGFLRDRLIEAGLHADKIHVVHNMATLPAIAERASPGDYVAFTGRLSEEKGLHTLLEAARRAPEVPIRIAGDGPLRAALAAAAPPNVQFMGLLDRASLGAFYASARFAVVPSTWWETFGLVAAEAMGHGLPVVASHTGALPEIVADAETGLLVPPGDPEALADALRALWSDPARCTTLGAAARARAVERFSADRYFNELMAVYTNVVVSKEQA